MLRLITVFCIIPKQVFSAAWKTPKEPYSFYAITLQNGISTKTALPVSERVPELEHLCGWHSVMKCQIRLMKILF